MQFDRGSLRQIGLATTALSAILCIATPAFADGNNFFSPVTNFITSPFGNNQQPGDDPNDIDYRPRPTLVVPPNSDLPPPQSAVARPPADWPKSSDSAAARRARADSRRPAPTADSMIDGKEPPPESDAPQTTAGGQGQRCSVQYGMPVCVAGPLADMGALNWFGNAGGLLGGNNDTGEVHLSGTPRRKYLSDPPVTYLAPVPISDEEQKEANQKATEAPSVQNGWCMMPGWFGCPAKQEIVHVSGSQSAAAAPATQGQPSGAPAAPAQPAAPPAPKTCMFGGFSGCSNN